MNRCIRCVAAILLMLLVCQAALAESGTLVLPENLKEIKAETFAGASGFDSVVLPQGVTAIGSRAFAGCAGLAKIFIPGSVLEIADDAFEECGPIMLYAPQGSYALTYARRMGIAYEISADGILAAENPKAVFEYTVKSGKATITGYTGSRRYLEIPKKIASYPVTAIGDLAFWDNTTLVKVTIPQSVTSIGNSAFDSCRALQEVKLPQGLTKLGEYAFYNCKMLEEIELPGSLSVIPRCSFDGCSLLSRVVIGDGVKGIESYAFSDCENLTAIRIPASIVSINDEEGNVFSDCGALTIYGTAGSRAEIYAKKYSIPFAAIEEIPQKVTGAAVVREGDYVYRIADGAATILRYGGDENHIVTPKELGGYPVTVLDGSAFCDHRMLESIVISEGVAVIRNGAFSQCTSLASVTLPASLRTLSGFFDCKALRQLHVPDGVTSIVGDAFFGCENLEAMYIPPSVIKAPENHDEEADNWESETFDGCDKLTIYGEAGSYIQKYASRHGIRFEEAVGGIPVAGVTEDGFAYTTNNGEAKIRGYTGSAAVLEIPQELDGCPVTAIDHDAFWMNTTLRKVVIPQSVMSIGNGAFASCRALEEVVLPDGLTKLGMDAFTDCKMLEEIELPGSLAGISWNTFSGCSMLSRVVIGDGVKRIESYAFSYCENLTAIRIPSSVTRIDSNAFCSCDALTIYGEAGSAAQTHANAQGISFAASEEMPQEAVGAAIRREGDYLYRIADGEATILHYGGNETSIVTPQELGGCPVTMITMGAYSSNQQLKSLTVSEGVATIEIDAFSWCESLISVSLPDSLRILSGFGDCSALKEFHVPNGVTHIGGYAFSGCKNLEKIYIPASVTSVSESYDAEMDVWESGVFDGCDKVTIYGEAGSYIKKYASRYYIPFKAVSK